jgi:hypothetical protein
MSSTPSALPARLILGILAALVIGFVGWLVYRDNGLARTLVERGVGVDGTVYSTSCGDHGRINYAFTVSGRSHLGSGSCAAIECSAVNVGDRIHVTYDPEFPQNSTCLPPSRDEDKARGGYAAVIILGVIMSIGIWRITRSNA